LNECGDWVNDCFNLLHEINQDTGIDCYRFFFRPACYY
jgi:hypothetical protein